MAMQCFVLLFHDGSRVAFQESDDLLALGRSHPAALRNPCISRQQFKLSRLPDGPGLQLEALGMHDVVVEARESKAEGSAWRPIRLLSPGQRFQPLLAECHRFFIAGLRDESLVHVLSPGTAADVSEAPNKTVPAASSPAAQSTELLDGCRPHTVEQCNTSAVPPQQQQQQQQQQQEQQAAGLTSDQHQPHTKVAAMHVIDLTLSDTEEEEEEGRRAAKRPRTGQGHALPAPRHATCQASRAQPLPQHAPQAARQPLQRQEVAPSPGQSHVPDPSRAVFSLFYVKGVAPGWNRGCLGIKLWELVPEGFQLAVVMDMMVDLPWLLSACPQLARGGQVIVCHGEGQGEGQAALRETCTSRGLTNFVFHAPPLPIEYGSHHTKAMLLQFLFASLYFHQQYSHGLRVVVHTANLIYADCNNKTQAIWWQDFPVKDAQSPRTSPFEHDLTNYCAQLRLPSQDGTRVREAIAAHDMSSARAHLVPSIPGRHTGRALHQYGHMRLRALLQQEPLPDPTWVRSSSLVVQCSSLGSLTEQWLLGEFGTSLLAHAQPAPATGGTAAGPAAGSGSGRVCAHTALMKGGAAAARLDPARLSFVWPAVSEVRNSLEGWAAGGSIPGPEKNVRRPFLQRHYCTFGGRPAGRMRAMPHIKSYCRYMGQQLAWVLIASHNMSKAAWGELQKNGTQLFMRSYELGTLHTPALEAAYLAHRHVGFSLTTCGEPHHLGAGPSPRAPAAAGGSTGGAAVQLWSLASFAGSGAQSAPTGAGDGAGGSDAAGSNGCGSSGSGNGGGEVLKLAVPLPYTLPPQPYRRAASVRAGADGDEEHVGDEPWAVDVLHEGLDILGRSQLHRHSHYGHLQDQDQDQD